VQELLEKSLEMHTAANYQTGMGRTKIYLGDFLWRKNDPATGIRQLEEGLNILRQVNHRIQLPNALNRLGLIYLWQGQTGKAEKLLKESMEISEELNKKQDLSYAYANLGLVRVVQNRLDDAETLFNQAMALRAELGQQEGVLWAMEGRAVVAIKRGDYARAQALLLETRHLRKVIEAPVLPHTLKFIIPVLLTYKEMVDQTKNQPLPAHTTPVAIKPVALPDASRITYPTSYNAEAQAAALSKRETEVLHLVSLGHPTSQIAKLLVISPGTVNNHLNSIYSKLGVNSRTSAVRFALDNGII
jgi:DNA-binding CsgD family transcriptional regulator/Tfp pilus assembly protein PilF